MTAAEFEGFVADAGADVAPFLGAGVPMEVVGGLLDDPALARQWHSALKDLAPKPHPPAPEPVAVRQVNPHSPF